MDTAAVILAAGKGTRMKSNLPKVLHHLGGEPLVARVARTALRAAGRVVVVVGYRADDVRRALDGSGVQFAEQREQLGTAHAVMRAEAALKDFSGAVLILSGDVPLISAASIDRLLAEVRGGAVAALLTAETPNPSGYGRIVRDADGGVAGIVEEKDATADQRRITEINGGVYAFESRSLWESLHRVSPENAQGEYYLPDAVNLLVAAGRRVAAVKLDALREIAGVNTVEELERLNAEFSAGRV